MAKNITVSRFGSLTALLHVIRGVAGAALVALGFAVAILLIGSPLALLARGVYEGVSWLVRRGGTPALVEPLGSLSNVLATVILLVVLVRLFLELFNWRLGFRAGAGSARPVLAGVKPHEAQSPTPVAS